MIIGAPPAARRENAAQARNVKCRKTAFVMLVETPILHAERRLFRMISAILGAREFFLGMANAFANFFWRRAFDSQDVARIERQRNPGAAC